MLSIAVDLLFLVSVAGALVLNSWLWRKRRRLQRRELIDSVWGPEMEPGPVARAVGATGAGGRLSGAQQATTDAAPAGDGRRLDGPESWRGDGTDGIRQPMPSKQLK